MMVLNFDHQIFHQINMARSAISTLIDTLTTCLETPFNMINDEYIGGEPNISKTQGYMGCYYTSEG